MSERELAGTVGAVQADVSGVHDEIGWIGRDAGSDDGPVAYRFGHDSHRRMTVVGSSPHVHIVHSIGVERVRCVEKQRWAERRQQYR